MIRIILKIVLVVSVFQIISVMIPDSFTANVDSALSYFVGMQYSLQPFINVNTLMACEQIIIGYLIGVALFLMFMWFNRRTSE